MHSIIVQQSQFADVQQAKGLKAANSVWSKQYTTANFRPTHQLFSSVTSGRNSQLLQRLNQSNDNNSLIDKSNFKISSDVLSSITKIASTGGSTISETNLPYGEPIRGKVRDIYTLPDHLIMVTTDRQSAFDRLLATIPYKGHVLNSTARWWFDATSHITRNSWVSTPHPNVTFMAKARVFPVEFVVRGYITGSTNTSLWTHYARGERVYCGHNVRDGYVKNQQLDGNIVTPTTKDVSGDELTSGAEIVQKGLMTEEQWQKAEQISLALFSYGQQVCQANGLILVDTKYELGLTEDGEITLIDEIHTPDSSRFWLASTYEERLSAGLEPDNIDKEFLRLWFAKSCDPYKDETLPKAPVELVIELAKRYVYLYEKITGEEFTMSAGDDVDVHEQIVQAVDKEVKRLGIPLQ